MDLTTGAEEFGGPTTVEAKYPGTGDGGQGGYGVHFDAGQYAERQGLLLLNGVVYTGWTSPLRSTSLYRLGHWLR